MDADELAIILREMYDGAKRNEAACQVHLFGIQYAQDLQECGCPLRDIVQRAGIRMGYLSEISKGIKLSRYVEVKEGRQRKRTGSDDQKERGRNF